MDKKAKKIKNGRLVGNPLQEFIRYIRVHHVGEAQSVALARKAREARECHEARAARDAAKARLEEVEMEAPRSVKSIENDEWYHKYTDFQISLKVHQPVASHKFLVDIFRGTNVVVSERDERERFNIRLSCGMGKTTIVEVIERDPDEAFSVAPTIQTIDEVGIELHLASNSLDVIRVNLAEHGCQAFDKNLAMTVMFRDLEYVGNISIFY